MPIFKEEKRSYCNTNKIYASKGDKVKIVRDATPGCDVIIVEDKKGVRFACTKDEII